LATEDRKEEKRREEKRREEKRREGTCVLSRAVESESESE
jgi:hypothetical protein